MGFNSGFKGLSGRWTGGRFEGGGSCEMETDIWRVTLKVMLGSSDCSVLRSLYSLYMFFRNGSSVPVIPAYFFRSLHLTVSSASYIHCSTHSRLEIAVNVPRTTSAWIPVAHRLSGWQVVGTAQVRDRDRDRDRDRLTERQQEYGLTRAFCVCVCVCVCVANVHNTCLGFVQTLSTGLTVTLSCSVVRSPAPIRTFIFDWLIK